jgi:hypothetical protein
MKLRRRLKKAFNMQWIKHSLLDLRKSPAKSIFGILGISISLALLTGIGMVNDTMNFNYLDMKQILIIPMLKIF